MSETEKTLEATVKEVTEASAADAPKKNAVPAEPTHLKNDAEDLGPAVVKSTDSNPDATKKIKQVSGDPQQKSKVLQNQHQNFLDTILNWSQKKLKKILKIKKSKKANYLLV